VPIPDFQTLMRPLLSFVADGKLHTIRDGLEELAKAFQLTESEKPWNLMIDFGLGVSSVATYEIKKIDNDYFDEVDG